MTVRALVVGGGPAGLATATRLAGWCDTVTVAEARPRDRRAGAGEHLPPAALTALAAVGLAPLLRDTRHDPSPGVRSAWGEDAAVDREYFLTAPGRGLNLRREHFDESLARGAEQAGAELRFGARLTELSRDARGYTAALHGPDGATTFRAEVVVDASGRRAAAARALGAVRRRHDELIGLTGRVEGCAVGHHTGRVHLEAVADGWWYGIGFSDGTVLATFMTDASLIRDYPGTGPALWRDRLGDCSLLAPLIDGGEWDGRVRAFDAATQRLDFEAPPGFLAVGDAATAYDPLSSWGITKGIRDGRAGADALARAHGGDPDAITGHRAQRRIEFERYRSRQADFYRAEARWPASPFWRARGRGLAPPTKERES